MIIVGQRFLTLDTGPFAGISRTNSVSYVSDITNNVKYTPTQVSARIVTRTPRVPEPWSLRPQSLLGRAK